jgi:cysteinyl-tRNA synthetase
VPDWAATAPVDLSAQADRLAALRAAAMLSKDFAPVDAMKSALTAAGVEVRMSKAGVELLPGPGFDPAKLEGL